MEIKRAIKKIIALGTGATMVGVTVLGAMAAADLGSYPAPFVVGSTYNAVAIVGANSMAADSIGVADVLLGLSTVEGAASSTTTAITTLEGDTYKLSKGTDELNLFEYLSADSGTGELENGPIGTVTKSELNALADGSITNEKGTFVYNQYIVMPDNGKVVYEVDSDASDDPALYLKFADSSLGYLYRMSFASALKSDIDSNAFDDLDNRKITMLGKDFTIISTDNSTGEINLMAGAVQDVLTESESKTYTINGIDYETEVIIITNTEPLKVKFKINGETTDALIEGGTFKLADGTEIGIRELLPNKAGDLTQDMVEFYLGAEKITITDADFTSANWAGTLTVGGEDVSNVYVNVVGTFPSAGTDVAISKIDINWTTGDNYYVPIGGKLSDQLESDQKDQLFLKNLDFEFTGVDFGETEEIKISDAAADKMKVAVPTKTGGDLNFYAFYSSGSTIALGKDATRPLITDASTPIEKNFQFIVSSGYYSHLLEATYFDTANTRVTFKDVGLGNSFKVTAAEGGTGTFYLDGYAYTFTASYTGANATFTNFGTDTAGEIWTPSEAKVKVSLNNASGNYGLVQFTEYRKGAADDSTSIKHVNVTVTDAGSGATDKITCNTPTSNDANFAMTSWDSKNNYYDGYTRWGTYVEYETPTGGQNPTTITYPIAEAIADVYLTSGVVSTVAGGEVDGLVQVDVGSAMLDTEVSHWEAQNIIVVGGPCVNRVAAELMGVGYQVEPECYQDFEEGKAKIKLFEDENVALLIAGYSSDDTRRACTVMKNYRDYAADLVGTEVEMTATTDADVELVAPAVTE